MTLVTPLSVFSHIAFSSLTEFDFTGEAGFEVSGSFIGCLTPSTDDSVSRDQAEVTLVAIGNLGVTVNTVLSQGIDLVGSLTLITSVVSLLIIHGQDVNITGIRDTVGNFFLAVNALGLIESELEISAG